MVSPILFLVYGLTVSGCKLRVHVRGRGLDGRTPNSGLQYSCGVAYGTLSWIYNFGSARGLGIEPMQQTSEVICIPCTCNLTSCNEKHMMQAPCRTALSAPIEKPATTISLDPKRSHSRGRKGQATVQKSSRPLISAPPPSLHVNRRPF